MNNEVKMVLVPRASAKHHDGTTLAVLTLGAFDASELGDIDISVCIGHAESLQQKLVSVEDIHVDLVSAEWARGLEQEVEDCWGTIDKMHMQALGAEDRAKEIVDLRATLAERDALLREAASDIRGWRQLAPKHKPSLALLARIEAALSANAEPTAPKCCEPTAEEEALLAACEYQPEELWGAPRPTCPRCIKGDPSPPKCGTCNDLGHVPDGEITDVGGAEFQNGAVKCIKDCPDCTPVERDGLEGVEDVAKSIGERMKSRAAMERNS